MEILIIDYEHIPYNSNFDYVLDLQMEDMYRWAQWYPDAFIVMTGKYLDLD